MKSSVSFTWQQNQPQTNQKYSSHLDDYGHQKMNNQQQQQMLQQQQQQQTFQQQQQQQSLARQRSDSSYDRSKPLISRRLRYDSESEDQTKSVRNQKPLNGSSSVYASNHSIDSFHTQTDFYSLPGSRPITPGFPNLPSTPLFNNQAGYSRSASLPHKYMMLSNGGHSTPQRSESPAFSTYQATSGTSRRASVSSEPADVSPQSVKLVKDSHKFWYKPSISREEAIAMLRQRPAGTFVVRDSNSFPGAFGLALKVSTPPTAPVTRSDPPGDELIRHFLIEPTSKGVKLKGYSNEPVFGSLSALVYQHTLTPLALPTKLTLPSSDLAAGVRDSVDSKTSSASQMQMLLSLGAACNVYYLFSLETDSLTGPLAIKKAVGLMLSTQPTPTLVHFKVSSQGITLTDNTRKLFFRKHYNTNTISYCAVDADDRKWTPPKKSGGDSKSYGLDACRIFGFVARNPNSRSSNQCHIFAEEDPDQPARAIVNFVNKVLLNTNSTVRSEVV
jgi:tensin